MADCASLLDEELSSFVFNYLTENSDSQVRFDAFSQERVWGYPWRCSFLHVTRRVAGDQRFERGGLCGAAGAVGSISKPRRVELLALRRLDAWRSRGPLEEMSSAWPVWATCSDEYRTNTRSRCGVDPPSTSTTPRGALVYYAKERI